MNLKLAFLNEFEDELYEFYLRRNILVHNGGTVNSIYLSKVAEKYKKGINITDRISVSEKYLERAISMLHTIFTLIACELWKKLDAEDESRCVVLMELGYEYLSKENYDISELASACLCQDSKMPIASRTAAQMNFWLAKKRGGKIKDVKQQIDDADFSDKSKVFQVALYALREEPQKFFALLPQVIKIEELSIKDLFGFPIFEEMRRLDDFKKFVEENSLVQEYLNSKVG